MNRRLILARLTASLAATLALIFLVGALGVVTASTSVPGSDGVVFVPDSPALLPLAEEDPPSSPLIIAKTADVSSAGFGDEIEFRLYVRNETNESLLALVI